MATQREMYHGNELYAWRENAANRTRAIDVDKWAQNQADILHLPGAQGEKKLSILDNVISPSSAFVRVDTEGGAPADDLAAITPGDLHAGMLLHLVAADSERVVTLRNSADATGIQTVDGKDVALDTQYGIVLRLVSTEALTYWEEIPGPLRAKKQPVASKDNLGLMQVGDNLDVTAQGVVSVPLAGKDKPGVIQPDGANLDIISGLLNLSERLQAELAEQELLRKLSIGWHAPHKSRISGRIADPLRRLAGVQGCVRRGRFCGHADALGCRRRYPGGQPWQVPAQRR